MEDWKQALDNKLTVGVLSTDMSKAFGFMWPPLLVSKLKAYGLSNQSLALMESYFEDRKNRVRLGNVKSEWKTAKRGCPQGSALGPVLWNIYQNDLFYSAIRAQLNTYADDHLQGNLRKYQVMVMSKSGEEATPTEVKIDNHTIQNTEQTQLLGITLDNKLSFTHHLATISRSTSR